MRQLKADKNKEKRSQHDSERVVDKEETPVARKTQSSISSRWLVRKYVIQC